MIFHPEPWRGRAACHPDNRPEGMSRADWTAVFYPPKGGSVRRALEVCGGCPVRADCATYAETHRSCTRDGIWAGTTGRQRRRSRIGDGPGPQGYSDTDRRRALRLLDEGFTLRAAGRKTGIPWQTINKWRIRRSEEAA